ncbi:MAG: hypothetical protein FWC41_12265 [Firmicutes bacterium]|nr:hypothetical protein [Bacillota bacterium]
MDRTKWNVRKASKLLGLSERTLHRRIDEFGLVKYPDIN